MGIPVAVSTGRLLGRLFPTGNPAGRICILVASRFKRNSKVTFSVIDATKTQTNHTHTPLDPPPCHNQSIRLHHFANAGRRGRGARNLCQWLSKLTIAHTIDNRSTPHWSYSQQLCSVVRSRTSTRMRRRRPNYSTGLRTWPQLNPIVQTWIPTVLRPNRQPWQSMNLCC